MKPLIEIKNLSVSFDVGDGMLSAVHDLSLAIEKGSVYALVGESGCGKSTTAYSVIRLLNEETTEVTGEILFKDRNLLGLSRREMEGVRGKEIGMIFQNPLDSLNPVYRSGTQVAEAIQIDQVSRTEAWEKVVELYRQVQIPDAQRRARSFPHELSGGMRQRVMIAMMLSRMPELLICDEPTTALDVTIEAQILEIIKALKAEFDTAFLVITHNFGVVAEIADKIGVMYAGQLIEEGDVFTIFDNPLHPYTRALLRALPRQSKKQGLLETIEGVVPRILGDHPGCRFANRCAHARELCRTTPPPRLEVAPGHFIRCHGEVEA